MAKRAFVKSASEMYTESDLVSIRYYPHVLGWIMGYTKLGPKHSEWIQWLFSPVKDRMRSLFCHRGSYKSVTLCVGIIWYWLFNPNKTIILYRKAFNDVVETLSTLAKIMETPEVRELFRFSHGEYPVITKRKIGDGILDFSFRKSVTIAPSIKGLSKNSSIVGNHADVILMDDITDQKSRVSPAERRADQGVFRELTTNVCNKDGFSRLIGTFWVPFTQGGVEDLLVADPKKGVQPQDKIKIYQIEDMGIITPAELEEIRKTTTAQLFACNYLLKFISNEDAVFKDPKEGDWLFNGTEAPRACVDMAFAKEGDTTCLTIAAKLKDGRIQAVGFQLLNNGVDSIPEIVEKMKMYKCRKIYVETNKDSGWTASLLRKEGLNVRDYSATTNKNVRIASYGLEKWENTIWAYETDPQFMNQVLDWIDERNIRDDAVDSYASLIQWAFSSKFSNSERWSW